MIVRTLAGGRTDQLVVETANFASTRLLTRCDGLGFSFHISIIFADITLRLQYLNHFEAVYCIAGIGEVEDLRTGAIHLIEPGVFYAVDRHDPHILRARSELKLACIFNPALSLAERHDADGSYPPPGNS